MNELVKKKWVEALRSGIYDQDKLKLKTDEGYCCLGVLCDILGQDFEGLEVEDTEILPDPIREKAGLDDRNPELEVDYYDFDDEIS